MSHPRRGCPKSSTRKKSKEKESPLLRFFEFLNLTLFSAHNADPSDPSIIKSHLQESDLSPLSPLPNSSFHFWKNEKAHQKMNLESQQQQQQEGWDLCPFFLSPEEEEDLEARSVLCLVEVEEQCGSPGCLDSNVYIEDCIKVEVETADDDYSPCIVLDIAQENSQMPWWGGDHPGNMNGDDLLANMQKIFQRQASLKTEKAAGEKASDSLNNKWKKYKHAAPFDSRKIVIMFSVMSSLGTLILIYLTLRVKLKAEGYAHTS